MNKSLLKPHLPSKSRNYEVVKCPTNNVIRSDCFFEKYSRYREVFELIIEVLLIGEHAVNDEGEDLFSEEQ